ncbi:MAG: LLM class flavin-dependent oxidoreductase [Nitrososphaerales archaeon]
MGNSKSKRTVLRIGAKSLKRAGIFLESLSLEDTFSYARLADERGFDSIWLPEITWSDAFSLATAAAMNTKKIRLATGVVGIYGRSPALMAMSVAGLDELSGGRQCWASELRQNPT